MHVQEVLTRTVLEVEGTGLAERRALRPPAARLDLRDRARITLQGVPLGTHGVPHRVLQAVAPRGEHRDRVRVQRDSGDVLRAREVALTAIRLAVKPAGARAAMWLGA